MGSYIFKEITEDDIRDNKLSFYKEDNEKYILIMNEFSEGSYGDTLKEYNIKIRFISKIDFFNVHYYIESKYEHLIEFIKEHYYYVYSCDIDPCIVYKIVM